MVKINLFGIFKKIKHKTKKSKKTATQLKKPKKKRAVKKKALPKKQKAIALITHRFSKIEVAVIKLRSTLKIGDTIRIEGHTTDFKQKVKSMQIDHAPITIARASQEIGLLVEKRVRINDKVFIESKA